jgi:hypothetical protein
MRPRLFALLDRGASGSVTLVAAPAGSGKTMLLSSWLRSRNLPGSVASCVGRDESDATRFWAMVMDALRDSVAITPGDALTTLMPAPLGGQEEFVRHLQEGLQRLPQTVVLVLDDLHQSAPTMRCAFSPTVSAAAAGGRVGAGLGCRPGWRAPSSLQSEEGVGDRDERGVVVPAAVAAALEVVEPERVFEFAVVVLDPPPELGQVRELAQLGVGRQGGEPVRDGLVFVGCPLGEQPAGREFVTRGVCRAAQGDVRGPDAQRDEARVHAPARPLAPGQSDRGLLAGRERQLAQRRGLGR